MFQLFTYIARSIFLEKNFLMYLSNDAVHISEKNEKHATLVSLPVTLKFMENDLASMTDQYVFDIVYLFFFIFKTMILE